MLIQIEVIHNKNNDNSDNTNIANPNIANTLPPSTPVHQVPIDHLGAQILEIRRMNRLSQQQSSNCTNNQANNPPPSLPLIDITNVMMEKKNLMKCQFNN